VIPSAGTTSLAGQIGAVKFLEASGVYWREDEKNERLVVVEEQPDERERRPQGWRRMPPT
jgi:hypothetical protein